MFLSISFRVLGPFGGGQAVALEDRTRELESVGVRAKTRLSSFPVTQFPHLNSDIISPLPPMAAGWLREGDRGKKLSESRRWLHCLPGFLASPSQTHWVVVCKVPGKFAPFLEARPGVHAACSL